MNNTENKKSELEQAKEDLFNYAIDRDDVKWLMKRLPKEAEIKPNSVEYELQILKIVSVGWSMSYYLENATCKDQLLELYWNAIFEFSQTLSSTTGLMIGHDIDYFQVLKDRLNMYVNAMAKKPDASEPVSVIGPEFARTCGNVIDIFTIMAGSKMFMTTISRVKEYFEKSNLI